MIHSYPFSSVPGFSTLYCDAVDSLETTMQNLTAVNRNTNATSHEYASKNSEIIRSTMHGVELSKKQSENLALLEKGKASVIITGQQIGLLGGPFYGLHKAMSCIHYAKQSSSENAPVIPVFWIEDNDHDIQEAGKIAFINAEGLVQEVSCYDSEHTLHVPTGELVFDDAINTLVTEICTSLPDTEFGREVADSLELHYQSGMSWTDSFVSFMHRRLGELGILFYSANQARKSGIFSEVIKQELQNPKALQKAVEIANQELVSKGYHKQAEASAINLFYHAENNARHKIQIDESDDDFCNVQGERITLQALVDICCNKPELFSPTVLLRPVIQDSILPTIGMVVGPGEMAYMNQLEYAYEIIGKAKPVLLPRHSFTLLPQSIVKYLDKYQIEPSYFMRIFNEVERELSNTFASDYEEEILMKEILQSLDQEFDRLEKYAIGIDKSLSGAVQAGKHGIEKSIEGIQKKIQSSRKRNNEALFGKAHEVSAWIFPLNHLQERTLSSISCEVKCGIKGLVDILDKASNQIASQHNILPLVKTDVL